MKFENIVVGQFNEMAVKALEMVTEAPGRDYPILVIQGDYGSGKSFLVNNVEKENPGITVMLKTADSLMEEMIKAMRNNTYNNFNDSAQNVDLLIVDDLQELKHRSGTQDFLLKTLKNREKSRKQTILTTCESIQQLEGISMGFRNYLLGSLIVDINKPNFEDRFAVVKNIAKSRGLSLNDDVVTHIADTYTTNLREIEGAVLKLGAVSKILKISVTIEIAKEHLRAPRPGLIKLTDVLDFNLCKALNLPVVIGKDTSGGVSHFVLETAPHLLVAGTTGSGKSMFLHSMLYTLMTTKSADNLKLILIDPKQLEFQIFKEVPHLLAPVISDSVETLAALKWAKEEMDRRLVLLKDPGKSPLPRIVIVIDEYADLKFSAVGRKIESLITTIADESSSSGIHIVISTQRISDDVISEKLKMSFPSRVCFKVFTSEDSRLVLDTEGAEKLLGKGEMLLSHKGSITPLRGAYIDEDAIEEFVEECDEVENYDNGLVVAIKGAEESRGR